MDSKGVDPTAISYGTMALTTTAKTGITYRTAWKKAGWGTSLLDFWDDFAADGRVEKRPSEGVDMPSASLVVRTNILPKDHKTITFLLTWHFPNRHTWSPGDDPYLGNYYATHYGDAWDVASKTAPRLKKLEQQTVRFVSSLCGKRPARGRKGSRSFQSQHPADANVLPHPRWTFIWLGGIQRSQRLLHGLLYACVELRTKYGVSIWRSGPHDARY